jgi:YidC/Oxa1 family membrane protein insertase
MHTLIGNWGWTIVAFTIADQTGFVPAVGCRLSQHGKMKVVTPKMQACASVIKTIRKK